MADFALSAEIDLRTRNLSQVIRQIQSGIGSAKGNINIGVSQRTQANISRVNKGLSTTNRVLKTTQKQARDTADSIEYFGKQSALAIRRFAAFTIVTTGFINFSKSVRQSISDAIDFQRELVKISQVTGRTLDGLSDLRNEITRLSTSLGSSSNELLQASRTLSQTGLSAENVRKSLQAIARSDLSPTFDSITDTTEGSVAIFRQFNVTADDLEKKLSSINSVSKKFAIESGDVITAVRRAGGAFQASGGSLEQFIALLTSVRSTTRESAESIATGFRTIFTRLQRTRTQDFLSDLDINLRDAENQFVGPFEAIRRLSTALTQIPSTDPRFAQVIEELGGFRQVTKVIPLIKQFAVSEEALSVALKENNSLALDSEIAQEALAVQIAKVREEFEALIRTVADSTSFKTFTNVILDFTRAAISLSDALVPLLPALSTLATIQGIRLSKRFFGEQGGGGFLSTLASGGIKRNRGGSVPGVGNSDSVRALLTPGEYVLNKKAVQKIGIKNLDNFNNAARFATGGLVGGISSTVRNNPGLSAVGITLGVQALAGSFKDLNDGTREVITTLGSAVTQFVLLNSAIKSNYDSTRRAKEIQESKNKEEKFATVSTETIDKRDTQNNTRRRAIANIQGEIENEKKLGKNFYDERKKLEEDFIKQKQENEKYLTEQKLKTAEQEKALLQKEASITEKINKAKTRATEKTQKLDEKYNQTRIQAQKKSRSIDKEISDLGTRRNELDASRPSGLVLSSKDIKKNVQIDEQIADIATKQNNLLKERDAINAESLETTKKIKAEQKSISVAFDEEKKSILESSNLDKERFTLAEKRKAQAKQVSLNKKQESQLQSEINSKQRASEDSLKRQIALEDKVAIIEKKRVASNDRYNRQIDFNNKLLLEQQNITKEAEKRAKRAQRFTQAGIIGGVVAGAAGQFLSNRGSAAIQGGSTSTNQSAFGGALTGAATGAALGSLIGPWGTALGAAAGAAVGFATSLSEARSQIEQVQLAEVVEGVALTLGSISRGSLTAQQGAFGLSRRVRDISRRQLANAGDPETSRNIQSDINTVIPKLTVFLTELAKGSDTFEEFNKRGDDIISFLSAQQNIPVNELTKTYEAQIKQQNDLKRVTDDNLAQRERESQRLREINVITVSVANSFRQLEKVQSSIARQSSLLSGNVQIGGFSNQAAGFSQLSTLGNVANFEQQARDIGSLFGDAGQRIAEELVTGAQISNRLPDILVRLRREDPLGESGEFIPRLRKELEGVPEFISKAIITQAEAIIGNEGKDVTIINELRKDLLGVSKQLVSTIEDVLGRPLEEAGQELTSRKNAFTQGISDIQNAIDSSNRRRFQAVDVGQQLLQTRLDRPLNEGEANQEFIKKLDIIAENGPKTVDGIVQALTGQGGAQQRLQSARDRFNTLRVDGADGAKQAGEELKSTALEANRLTNSLKFLADNTILVANAQKELSEIENQRSVEQGFLETLLAGTPEEQQALAKQLNAINVLIALQKKNNLQSTPKSILQAALPILKANPNAEFQGVEFEKLLQDTLKALTPSGLAGFGQGGDKEKNARERLITALKQQKKANEELAKIYRNTGNKIADAIKPLLSDFITEMKAAFLEAEKRAAANERAQAEADLRTAEGKRADTQLAAQIFGVDTKQIGQIKAASEELLKLDSVLKQIETFKAPEDIQPDFSAFGEGIPRIGVQNRAGSGNSQKDIRKRIREARTNQVNSFKEVTKAVIEQLGEAGFDQDQIAKFQSEFQRLAGPEIENVGGLTAEEASDFFKTIIKNISEQSIESLEEERRRLEQILSSNTLFDTQVERNEIVRNIELFGEELQRVDEKFNESTVDKYRESLRLIDEKLDRVQTIQDAPIEAKKPFQQKPIQQRQEQQRQEQKRIAEQAAQAAQNAPVPFGLNNEQIKQGLEQAKRIRKKRDEEKKRAEQVNAAKNVAKNVAKNATDKPIDVPIAFDNPFDKRRAAAAAREQAILNRQKEKDALFEQGRASREEQQKRRADAIAARNEAQAIREQQLAAERKRLQDERAGRVGTLEAQKPSIFDTPAIQARKPEQRPIEARKPIGFIDEKLGKELGDNFKDGTKNIQSASENLLEVMKVMPQSIDFKGNLTLDLILNGAEVLSNIQPEISRLVETQMKDVFTKFLNNQNSGIDTNVESLFE